MFKDIQVEKIGAGRFRVSFTTEDPAMLFLTRFFSLMSKEADTFFRRVVRAQNNAELSTTRDTENAERLAAATWKRRKIRARFDAMDGSRSERVVRLRRELCDAGEPVSYDRLVWILSEARKEGREELAGKIRELAAEGRPLSAMAEELRVSVAQIEDAARRFGIDVNEDALRVRLEDTVRRLAAEGLSLAQLSNRLNVPRPVVRSAARSAGVLKANPPGRASSYVPGDVEPPTGAALAAAVAQLAATGLSFNQVARKLRVSWYTVARHAESVGIENPHLARVREHADKIAELARQGLSSARIGKLLKLSPAWIRKHPAWKENIPWYRKSHGVTPGRDPELPAVTPPRREPCHAGS